MPRPSRLPTKPAEAIHENPDSRGRGILCPLVILANLPRNASAGSRAFAEISSATADPPRCSGPPTPEEKARRLAVLRAVLADSAPAFQARIDAGERGEQP